MNNLLVTLADRNFIAQAKQLFSSAYWNGGWRGDFLLLAHEIPETDLKWFREKGIIVFKCEPLIAEEKSDPTHPSVALDKLYLFTPFFKKWDRVVFLDADIMVRASLERLANLEDWFAAAKAGKFTLRDEFLEENPGNRRFLRQLGRDYRFEEEAFNTGVMAFKTKIIDENLLAELLGLYRQFDAIDRCGEETVLNIHFYRKWKMLPLVYNAFPFYFYEVYGIPYEKIEAVILHPVGGADAKPWFETSCFYAEWSRNLEKADAIDLAVRREPKETWTEERENGYPGHPKPFRFLLLSLDRLIGKVGLVVKKKSPRLYERIRIKNE